METEGTWILSPPAGFLTSRPVQCLLNHTLPPSLTTFQNLNSPQSLQREEFPGISPRDFPRPQTLFLHTEHKYTRGTSIFHIAAHIIYITHMMYHAASWAASNFGALQGIKIWWTFSAERTKWRLWFLQSTWPTLFWCRAYFMRIWTAQILKPQNETKQHKLIKSYNIITFISGFWVFVDSFSALITFLPLACQNLAYLIFYRTFLGTENLMHHVFSS